MELSAYQKDILGWAATNSGNAVVEAKAGTGKTFTLVELLKVIRGKVIFLAFNKHIAEELQLKAPMHVQVSTTNAFGNMVVRSSMIISTSLAGPLPSAVTSTRAIRSISDLK